MKYYLNSLGNPHLDLPIIHITGTNGKGSVVSYLDNIFRMHNLDVGCFTSPYIINFNERIRYNNKSISDDDLLYYGNIIYNFFPEWEKEINETKVQFDGVYAEAEKLNYFLENTTHPIFVTFEFKYQKTIEKYNFLMKTVDELQAKHLLLEVTGDDLASHDNKIAKEHKVFKDSLPEYVKKNAYNKGTFYVEEIIETMVKIPGKDYLMGKYEVTQEQWQLIMLPS
jgi:hypothetical protein